MNALAQLVDPGPELDQGERKYLLDATAAEAFWTIAMAHLRPQLDVDARPVAYSRTTYFDTPDLAYFRSSQSGIARRLRVREYAHSARLDEAPVVGERCFVELKQSSGGLRSKTRVAVGAADVPTQLAVVAGESSLQACVATWYRRRALTDDTGLRVTLDDRLLLCKPRPLGSAFAEPEIVGRGPAFILEVKHWDAPPTWLAHALAGLEEAINFSKFMLGMRAVSSTMRRERDITIPRGFGQVVSLDEVRARNAG